MLRKRQTVIAYQRVFESPDGRVVLDDLKKHCPLLTDNPNMSNGLDVNKLLVQTGEANVLKYIYRMLKRDPNEERPAAALNIVNTGIAGD